VHTMDRDRLNHLLGRFSEQRVAIFGDLMVDRYVWGAVSRISPEAPVPVVEVERETTRFGGAANVAENVAALGASAVVVGVVGGDREGEDLLASLEGRGVDVGCVVRAADRPTTTKTRIVAHSQQVVRADREESARLSDEALTALGRGLSEALSRSDVLIISDYGKGVVTEDTLAVGLEEARNRETIVCVDPKESHFGSYVGVTAITPNQKEAGGAVGIRIGDDGTLTDAGWKLRDMLDAECVVITRGEQGMSLFLRGGELVHLPTVAREVFDVTGAGDTVVSALAVALACGATMVEAAMIANHAAGLVIREVGTASATIEEIARSFEEERERDADG